MSGRRGFGAGNSGYARLVPPQDETADSMPTDLSAYRSFAFKAGGAHVTRATPEAVWSVVTGIGGDNRYYAMNALWTMREWLDALVGGPGMQRGRTSEGELRPGDRIDSWEVLAARPPELLALVFKMKAPGDGVLEFAIRAKPRVTRLTVIAYWEPDELAGVLYWRAMQPAHVLLFRRLTAEICRRAEAAQVSERTQPMQKRTA